MKNVEWVIGTLRNGDQEYVRTLIPNPNPAVLNTHNYQAMYYDDGSYAGINEIVFNFKPWLDWYLQTTGQRLVGGFAGPSTHAHADTTSGASSSGGHGGKRLAQQMLILVHRHIDRKAMKVFTFHSFFLVLVFSRATAVKNQV